jgi:hypothetical protein
MTKSERATHNFRNFNDLDDKILPQMREFASKRGFTKSANRRAGDEDTDEPKPRRCLFIPSYSMWIAEEIGNIPVFTPPMYSTPNPRYVAEISPWMLAIHSGCLEPLLAGLDLQRSTPIHSRKVHLRHQAQHKSHQRHARRPHEQSGCHPLSRLPRLRSSSNDSLVATSCCITSKPSNETLPLAYRQQWFIRLLHPVPPPNLQGGGHEMPQQVLRRYGQVHCILVARLCSRTGVSKVPEVE